jgi:hypothetical protein
MVFCLLNFLMVKKPPEPTSENADTTPGKSANAFIENTGIQLRKCMNLRYRRVTHFLDLGSAPTRVHPNQSNNKRQVHMPRNNISAVKRKERG